MEKTIFTYLDFLLPIHNCVTIPEFGAFILNVDSASITHGAINPPTYSVTFNPELTHNDGILTSRIIADEQISYNASYQIIKDFVKEIRADLNSGKTVQCGKLGTLSMDKSGHILFSHNKTSVHPMFFGLTPVSIGLLANIDRSKYKGKKDISLKYIIGTVAAAAAAILLFVMPSLNIKDAGNYESMQTADFLSSITNSIPQPSTQQHNLVENAITGNEEQTEGASNENNAAEAKAEVKAIDEPVAPKPTRTYYIVIGGDETKNVANRLLSRIKSSDFPSAAIVESPDRYRIYAASFTNKKEAESYLLNFRKDNPKYETAWLYSKRN